jgi:hypothetical protein
MNHTDAGSPRSALDEDALYSGDNGRIFCGALACAGMSAHFSGRTISGHRVEKIGLDDIVVWITEIGRMPECEGCGRTATLAVPARATLKYADKMRIECAMAVESWAIGIPEGDRKGEVLAWLALQDETTLRAIQRGHGLGFETWERALGRKDARA